MLNKIITIILLLSTINACKPDNDGLAHPRSCAQAQDCEQSEVCLTGFCGAPLPTSTAYSACELDADCPASAFCYLGACTHNCQSDSDCAAKTVCTNRGRCTAQDSVKDPAPIEAPAALSLQVSANSLEFSRGVSEQTLTLSSDSSINYRILSNQPWLSADPSYSSINGQPVTINVKIDRTIASSSTQGRLTIKSTGGEKVVQVSVARDLSGAYEGTVQITSPYQVAVSSLSMNLFDDGTGMLTGYVDPSGSLLFPAQAGVSGGVTQSNDVSLRFVLAGNTGSASNPKFPRSMQRIITLNGKFTGSGSMAGTFAEQIQGALSSDISVGGTFQLQRIGVAKQGTGEPVAKVAIAPLVNPYSPCNTGCPNGICTGDSFLSKSATFYDWFASATGNPYSGSYSDGVNTANLRCAQSAYIAGLSRPGGAIGLLDSLEVKADYALLNGNQKMVDASTPWQTPGVSLTVEVPVIQAAISYFQSGSHADDANSPSTILDPFVADLILKNVSQSDLASSQSQIKQLLNGQGYRAPYEYLRRQLLVTTASIRAYSALTDRQHRLNASNDATLTARTGAVAAYLDLAVLTQILKKAGAPGDLVEIKQLSEAFQEIKSKYDNLRAGRNPAGFSESYVPFLLSVWDLPKTNYQQIYAMTTDAYQTASASEQKAIQAGRDFETNENNLEDQIVAQEKEYDDLFMTLCGSTTIDDCGQPGSQIADAAHGVQTAALRVSEGQTNIDNLAQEITIEENRARVVSGIHDNNAHLILADGKRLEVLNEQEREINAFSGIFSSVINIATGIGESPVNPLGAINGTIGLFSTAFSTVGKADIEDERTRLTTMQQARVEFDSAKIETANSAAVIQTKLLQQQTLRIDQLIAAQSFAQASEDAQALVGKARYYDAQRTQQRALKTNRVRDLLQFRIYVGVLGLRAQNSFSLFLRNAYLATRSLEYELNVTYANKNSLWSARSVDDVNAYVQALNDFYVFNRSPAVQSYTTVLSMRDDILGFTDIDDKVTSATTTARERFNRFVADPANRDENGNLTISFSTYRPDKAFFSKSICADTIRDIRINLVGDNLGQGLTTANVKLTQGGVNYLRSCGEGDGGLASYDLSDGTNKPRVAVVQAGINAPSRATAGTANTDLVLRSTVASSWNLSIEQRPDYEPENRGFNTLGLDDIELIIDHEACTIQ